MGYDYPECIVCYCKYGINDGPDVIPETGYLHNICMNCIYNTIGGFCGRSRYYADEARVYDLNKCDFCKQSCSVGFRYMPICETCVKEMYHKE